MGRCGACNWLLWHLCMSILQIQNLNNIKNKRVANTTTKAQQLYHFINSANYLKQSWKDLFCHLQLRSVPEHLVSKMENAFESAINYFIWWLGKSMCNSNWVSENPIQKESRNLSWRIRRERRNTWRKRWETMGKCCTSRILVFFHAEFALDLPWNLILFLIAILGFETLRRGNLHFSVPLLLTLPWPR